MVPSVFVPLPELPLTPTGKIDRQRLPSPDEAVKAGQDAVAPRDHLELELVRVWEEVLGREEVGVRDNFFDLGGHSLLAVRLAAAVRRRLGRELPLALFFQGPTVEEVAAALRSDEAAPRPSLLVPLQTAGDSTPFFCVHPLAGNALCYRDLARHLGIDQPFYGLQSPALLPGAEPADGVEAMAERYLEEIRTVQEQGPYHLGGWSFGGLVAYEMAARLVASGQEVALLALIDASAKPVGGGDRRRRGGSRRSASSSTSSTSTKSACARHYTGVAPEERLAALIDHFQARRSSASRPDARDRPPAARRRGRSTGALPAATPHPFIPDAWSSSERKTGWQGAPRTPTGGWTDLTAGVDVHHAPGHHQNMVFAPHAEGLAQVLRRCLERTRARRDQTMEEIAT